METASLCVVQIGRLWVCWHAIARLKCDVVVLDIVSSGDHDKKDNVPALHMLIKQQDNDSR